MDYFNRLLECSRDNFEDTKKQLEVLDQEIATHLLQTHEAVTKVEEEVKNQSLLSHEDSERYIRIISEEIKNQTLLGQKSTLEAIDTVLLPTQQDTQKMFASAYEEMKTVLDSFSGQMKNLQEQIKHVLAELDSEVEDEMGKTENPDTAPTATKMVRRVTTQIERIAANQQKMSMSYYNNANDQAKQGFKLAWMLSIVGAILLGVTIIAAVFMTSLHLYGYTALLGTVGVIATAITTCMGGLSSLQARTAKSFASAHQQLDRSYRPTIAHAMCVGYTDEERKQAAIDKIIDGLLKNGDVTAD